MQCVKFYKEFHMLLILYKHMKRDLYIDFVKGIASISIIFIHTVFWSGLSYVPNVFREFSLLFDVPIFFLLSGLTQTINLKRNFKRLLKLQISYMLFVFLIFCIQVMFTYNLDLRRLVYWFMHSYSTSYPLEVVMGCMWYMQIYFLVLFCGLILLKILPTKLYVWLSLVFFVFIIILSYFYRYSLGLIVSVNFYIFIFLLGYLSK